MSLRTGTVVSTSWTTAPSVTSALGRAPSIAIESRRVDWGKRGARARLHHFRDALQALRRARQAQTLVLLTAGLEVYAVAAAMRVFRRPTRLVVVDFLMPATSRVIELQKWALHRVDAWGCIRSGDIGTLQTRFAVDEGRCVFIPFPPTFEETESALTEPGFEVPETYVYAAGNAHRDWETLFRALCQVDCDAVISGDPQLPVRFPDLPARIRFVGPLSPSDGRSVASKATIVLVPLQDTILPAGPVVLIDAMALGRPVIAADTNGTRDYVRHGDTGWLVRPGDPEALASAINAALSDPAGRERVGKAARRAARDEFAAAEFARRVIELC